MFEKVFLCGPDPAEERWLLVSSVGKKDPSVYDVLPLHLRDAPGLSFYVNDVPLANLAIKLQQVFRLVRLAVSVPVTVLIVKIVRVDPPPHFLPLPLVTVWLIMLLSVVAIVFFFQIEATPDDDDDDDVKPIATASAGESLISPNMSYSSGEGIRAVPSLIFQPLLQQEFQRLFTQAQDLGFIDYEFNVLLKPADRCSDTKKQAFRLSEMGTSILLKWDALQAATSSEKSQKSRNIERLLAFCTSMDQICGSVP